jgi:hypothetical protein
VSDENFWSLIVFAVLLVGGCVYGYYSIQECTKLHPLWYCIGNG